MKRNVLGLSMIALALAAGTALTASAQAQAAKPAAQPAAKPAEAAPKALGIGDAAPTLKVGKWIKGTEVASFEKGKIYVVEGWATWCGPCKIAIPHMTELAHKNKDKVTFIGVSVWENAKPLPSESAYTQRVQDFVQEMSDKMDYTVAIDTASDQTGHVAKNWLSAANQNGIPAAFIVNGEGKIAWIGNPIYPQGAIDKALDQIIAGTYDMNAAKKAGEEEAAKAAADRAEREKQMAQMKPVYDAIKAKDYAAAAKAYDDLIAKAKSPELALGLKMDKFNKLLVGDSAAAFATAKSLADNEFKDNAQGLNDLAWTILDTKTLKNPDYDLALSLAQKAADLTKNEDGMILDSLAYAQFKKGNIDGAIATQTKAVALVKGAPADTVKEMQARLDEFKAAKAKK